MKNNTTKRSLLVSVLALVLCFSMLVGTTFAWFTDSVTSARNQIVSGNLDVKLEYAQLNGGTWGGYTEVTDQTKVFKEGALYEPGYTELVKFKVTNDGSLALKYTFDAIVYAETAGTNKAGESFKLSDYLYTGTTTADADRATAAAAATTKLSEANGLNLATDAVLLQPQESKEFILVLTMPTTVDNKANHLKGAQPKIELGVELIATQFVKESDSFGPEYDKDAVYYDVKVSTADELYAAVAAATGDTVIAIDGNIQLNKALSKSGLDSIKFVSFNGNDVIDQATYNMHFNGAKVTFQGLTLTHGEKVYGDGGQTSTAFAVWEAAEVNYLDCTFNRSVGTIHAGLHNFIRCTFNGVENPDNSKSEYPLYICDGKDYNVVDCVFNCTNRGAILFYNDGGSGVDTLNISNTKFLGDIIAEKTAVEIHNNSASQTYNVNIKNVALGKGIINGLWRIKPGNVGPVNVNVDEESVYEGARSVSTAAELLALGGTSVEGTIILEKDIDLNGAAMPTIGAAYGKKLVVLGNGNTISNAATSHTNHNGMKHHGLFYAYTNSTLVIEDLVIENVHIDATQDTERNYGAAIVVAFADGGSNVTLKNVDVYNCSVLNNTPDIGDEAGVYVGYQTGTLTMIDCDSTGCSVAGETAEKTGAFIGMVNGTATLTNCTTDLTIGSCNRVAGTLTEN